MVRSSNGLAAKAEECLVGAHARTAAAGQNERCHTHADMIPDAEIRGTIG